MQPVNNPNSQSDATEPSDCDFSSDIQSRDQIICIALELEPDLESVQWCRQTQLGRGQRNRLCEETLGHSATEFSLEPDTCPKYHTLLTPVLSTCATRYRHQPVHESVARDKEVHISGWTSKCCREFLITHIQCSCKILWFLCHIEHIRTYLCPPDQSMCQAVWDVLKVALVGRVSHLPNKTRIVTFSLSLSRQRVINLRECCNRQ